MYNIKSGLSDVDVMVNIMTAAIKNINPYVSHAFKGSFPPILCGERNILERRYKHPPIDVSWSAFVSFARRFYFCYYLYLYKTLVKSDLTLSTILIYN